MKRTKPRTARAIRQPMMGNTRDQLALELRLAAEALIGAPSADSYNQLVRFTETLRTAGLDSPALAQASAVLTSICDRFDGTRALDVSAAEAESLRAAVDVLDQELATIPHNFFRAAVVITRQKFEAALGGGGTC